MLEVANYEVIPCVVFQCAEDVLKCTDHWFHTLTVLVRYQSLYIICDEFAIIERAYNLFNHISSAQSIRVTAFELTLPLTMKA